MRAVVFLPNWVGDVIMATPAMRALRRLWGPGAEIIGVARPYVAPVLDGATCLSAMWLYETSAHDATLGAGNLVRRLRETAVDVAVLFPNSFRCAWLAWRGGVRRRVGMARYGRGPLLTDPIRPLREGWKLRPVSALDEYLRVVYALGCKPESPRMELVTTMEEEQQAQRVWQQLGLGDASVIAFNIGGAYGPAKRWPEEYFVDLARQLMADEPCKVLVLCGPAEREAADRIAVAAGAQSLAAFPPSLGLLKGCLRRSRVLVTTDSGPRHIAAAFGRPVVTLFGPTDEAWTDIHYKREMRLSVPVPCRPCSRRVCPLGHHRCMRELKVELVRTAVCEALRMSAPVEA